MQSVTSSNHLEWTMFRIYIGSLNGCFMKKSKKGRKGGRELALQALMETKRTGQMGGGNMTRKMRSQKSQ